MKTNLTIELLNSLIKDYEKAQTYTVYSEFWDKYLHQGVCHLANKVYNVRIYIDELFESYKPENGAAWFFPTLCDYLVCNNLDMRKSHRIKPELIDECIKSRLELLKQIRWDLQFESKN